MQQVLKYKSHIENDPRSSWQELEVTVLVSDRTGNLADKELEAKFVVAPCSLHWFIGKNVLFCLYRYDDS